MPRVDWSLSGDKEIQRLLAQIPPQLDRKVIRQALRAAAKPILDQSKQHIAALRVTGEHTEPLMRGMKIRALKRRRGRFGVGVQTPTREELGIPPSARWYYPAHIELGTRKAPAEPYLRRSLEQKRQAAVTIIRQMIRSGIAKIVREQR